MLKKKLSRMDFREAGASTEKSYLTFNTFKVEDKNAFSRKGAILLYALVRAEGYTKPLFGLCNNQWGELRPCWKLQICKRGTYCRSALCSHSVSSSAKTCVAK